MTSMFWLRLRWWLTIAVRPLCVIVVVYVSFAAFLHWLHNYRRPPSTTKSAPSVRVVTANLWLNLLLVSTVATLFALVSPVDVRLLTYVESSLSECLWKVLFSLFVADAVFYWVHRLLHTPRLFRLIHCKHHEALIPYPLVTNYCHPIELLTLNLPTVVAGPALTYMSSPLFAVWDAFMVVLTELEHSSRPLLPWRWRHFDVAHHHFLHHRYVVRGNYGLTPLWDYLCGTRIVE